MTHDYYQILGVTPGATADAIRKAYRKQAFELHPDRHGGSREAEEAFKDLTEAYAVLGDARRKHAYDSARAAGQPWGTNHGPTGSAEFDPANLFRGMFQDPAFRSAFEQLAREFSSQGLRFDEEYLKKVFHTRRGPVVFGGVFFAGPLGSLFSAVFGPGQQPTAPPRAEHPPVTHPKPSLLHRLFGTGRPCLPKATRAPSAATVTYTLPVSTQTLADGGRVRITLPGTDGNHTYAVQVPAGSCAGTRLRLAGKGRSGPIQRGDLLLELRRKD